MQSFIETEINRFLATKESLVLCLIGRWGVGKTYAWKELLTQAVSKGEVSLTRSSYVSLFGINSLDDLKYSVFEDLSDLEPVSTDEAPIDKVKKWFSSVKKGLGVAQKGTFTTKYVGGLASVAFTGVKDAFVCLDDIERSGDGLQLRNILGLASFLKEQKRCKVLMILNEEALAGHAPDFVRYFEKVVDLRLTFSLTPVEAASLMFRDSGEIGLLLSDACVPLGIDNLRTLQKIRRYASILATAVAKYDKTVLREVVKLLSLFCWSIFEPEQAPSIDYLKQRRRDSGKRTKTDELTPQETAWNAMLDAYEFREMDELGLVISSGISVGFFDLESLDKHAAELSNRLSSAELDARFVKAWTLYHSSLADNTDEVIVAIRNSFSDSLVLRGLLDLNSTVWLLSSLGARNDADKCIEEFFKLKGEQFKSFNLASFAFADRIDQPSVLRKLSEIKGDEVKSLDPTSIIIRISESNSWDDEDLSALSSLPAARYTEIFKTCQSERLPKVINACLQFGRIANATEPMKKIAASAKEGLRQIGQESLINSLRVRKYGIDVADLTAPVP